MRFSKFYVVFVFSNWLYISEWKPENAGGFPYLKTSNLVVKLSKTLPKYGYQVIQKYQHKSRRVNTNQHESTQVRYESRPLNTSRTRVNTNQCDSQTSPKVSDTSQHESKSFLDEQSWVNTTVRHESNLS